MKMKHATGKQQGFTIIELVVVILLLGILAATALPRFMNVSTEAHNGVISGVEGSMRSGLALYRANWTAQGQPAPGTVVAEGLRTAAAVFTNATPETAFSQSSASGYPYGTADLAGGTFAAADVTSAACNQVVSELMDVSNIAFVAGDATIPAAGADAAAAMQTAIDTLLTANAGADFFSFAATDTGGTLAASTPVAIDADFDMPVCVYVYAGERGNSARSLVYVPATGDLVRLNSVDALYTEWTVVPTT